MAAGAKVGIRTGVMSHRSPWVRAAPWLLLVAVVFVLLFTPLMLLPEVERRVQLGSALTAAAQAVADAEAAATSLSRVAEELPALRQRVQAAEAGLVPLEELPAALTRLEEEAAATGVALHSVIFTPYRPVGGGGGGRSTGSGSTPTGTPAQPSSAGEAEIDGTQGAAVVEYGSVAVELVAEGAWAPLAHFAGRVVQQPGIRIQAWSAGASAEGGAFQLRLVGELYIRGRPPVAGAVQGEEGTD